MIIMGICYSKSNELIYLLMNAICFYQITNKNKFIAPCCLKFFVNVVYNVGKKHNTCPWCRNIYSNDN